MSFTSPRMIRGWFTEIPSWRGRDGTRIPESGLAARTSRSESASESASSAVLDGAGVIGDSIGITDTQCITTAGTTPGADTFYNRSNFYRGGGARGGVAPCAAAEVRRARRSFQPSRRNGQAFQRKPAGGSRIRCTPRSERRPLGRLQRLRPWRTGQELFVTRKRQLRWRSSAWRRRISRRRRIVAAAAGVVNRSFVMFLVVRKIWKWREAICGERS